MRNKDLKAAKAERRRQILQSGADFRAKVVDVNKKDPKRSRRAWKQNKEEKHE